MSTINNLFKYVCVVCCLKLLFIASLFLQCRIWIQLISQHRQTDLWNIDLLDAHLDLLDTDHSCKHFVCLQDVLQSSSRHVFKTSSRHFFKTSWRRFQRNNFSSSKTSSRRLEEVLRDLFKTSSWPFKDV